MKTSLMKTNYGLKLILGYLFIGLTACQASLVPVTPEETATVIQAEQVTEGRLPMPDLPEKPNPIPETEQPMATPIATSTQTELPETVLETEELLPTIVITVSPNVSVSPTLQVSEIRPVGPPTLVLSEADKQSKIAFERDGAWLMNGDGSEQIRISEDLRPVGWSPSGDQLLLANENNLYLANGNGTEQKLLYNNPDLQSLWGTSWLDDETILLQVWYDYENTHAHYLDVKTGNVEQLSPDEWRLILAVSPNSDFLIQWSVKGYEIVDRDGHKTPILTNFDLYYVSPKPIHDPSIVFLPDGNEIIFAGCPIIDEQPIAQCFLYRAAVSAKGLSTPDAFFVIHEEIRNLSNLSISTDGHYLSFIYSEEILAIWDLASDQMVAEWDLDLGRGGGLKYVLWSPYSSIVIYPKMDDATGFFGLNQLNVETGEFRTLIDFEDPEVEFAWDWR